MKIAICDDDIVFTKILLDKASHVLPASEFSVFSSGRDFWECFWKAPALFDAVILDIELEPGSATGIALAQQINRCNPQVQIIFISQYLDYAPQAYESSHIWYIDKNRLDVRHGRDILLIHERKCRPVQRRPGRKCSVTVQSALKQYAPLSLPA